ncbi:MAG: hypothetical protein EAZ61_05660, partial [Oscillatoriales cyanobacterium]
MGTARSRVGWGDVVPAEVVRNGVVRYGFRPIAGQTHTRQTLTLNPSPRAGYGVYTSLTNLSEKGKQPFLEPRDHGKLRLKSSCYKLPVAGLARNPRFF